MNCEKNKKKSVKYAETRRIKPTKMLKNSIFKRLMRTFLGTAIEEELWKNRKLKQTNINKIETAIRTLIKAYEEEWFDYHGLSRCNRQNKDFFTSGHLVLLEWCEFAKQRIKNKVGEKGTHPLIGFFILVELERYKGNRQIIDYIGELLMSNGRIERVYNRIVKQKDWQDAPSFSKFRIFKVKEKRDYYDNWEKSVKQGLRKQAEKYYNEHSDSMAFQQDRLEKGYFDESFEGYLKYCVDHPISTQENNQYLEFVAEE